MPTARTTGVPLGQYLDRIHKAEHIGSVTLQALELRLRDWGICVLVHDRFERLVEVNAANQGNRWFNVMPNFHPDTHPSGDAFWLEGVSLETGETVMTQAARCYRLWRGSLAETLESLAFFYRDPAAMKAPGEVCAVAAPSASRLAGTLLYSGGTWARTDWRGKGAAAVLPRVSRSLALMLWEPFYTVSLVLPVLLEKGIVRSYGYRAHEAGVRWLNSASQPDLDFVLIWMDRQELLSDLAACLELAGPIPA